MAWLLRNDEYWETVYYANARRNSPEDAYRIAQERCARWRKGKGAKLDLSCLGLRTLPRLPAGVREIDCSNNCLTSLTPEDGKYPLPGALWRIECSWNRLTSLPSPLPTQLKTLLCSYNQLTSLPSPLPPELEALKCYGNRLGELPPLPVTLRILHCGHNLIKELPTLLPPSLTDLECGSNRLCVMPTTLPRGLRSFVCCFNPELPTTSLPDPLPDMLGVLVCRSTLCPEEGEQLYEEQWTPHAYRARLRQITERLEEAKSRVRVAERTAKLKEDLVMAVWHPSRLQARLDAGEDLMSIVEM